MKRFLQTILLFLIFLLPVDYIHASPSTADNEKMQAFAADKAITDRDMPIFVASTDENKTLKSFGEIITPATIYPFIEKIHIQDTAYIYGVVIDKETRLPLESVRVTLLNDDNTVIKRLLTDSNGHYQFTVTRLENYLIHVEKEEYNITDKFIQVSEGKNELKIELTPNASRLKPRNNKKAVVYGRVIDKESLLPLQAVKLSLLNEENKVIQSIFTDSLGKYRFKVKGLENYLIHAEKKDYNVTDKMVQITQQKTEVKIALTRNISLLKLGTNLADALNIPRIYFDFGSSNIGINAAKELSKVIAVMKKYPALKIDIRTHTDSRGSEIYNQQLSSRRAEATMHYLVQAGIDKDRLSYKGYGESQLLNHCDDGVPCTAKQHQENRRAEFIVIQ